MEGNINMFQELKDEVQRGLEGRNDGIPMGFNRLNKYIGLRKSIYFLVGGLTGSGKTSFVDNAFVLNPIDFYLKNKEKSKFKLKIIYRSMERSRKYKLAKWVSRKIFIDQGILIPISKMLGWNNERMDKNEHDLFLLYEEYISSMKDIITIIDGPENPVGISKDLKNYAEERGEIIQIDKYNKKYIPKDENEITIVIIDHVGLLKTTKDLSTKKQAIDKMSNELQFARDFYGYTPVVISQFNRDISNPMRIKNGDVEPNLEDFKESSSTQEDSDVILALFDPMRMKVEDTSGYKLENFRDNFGGKYFRSLRLIKNSLGEDDLRIGLGFHGATSIFSELPRAKDMEGFDYSSLYNGKFFLK